MFYKFDQKKIRLSVYFYATIILKLFYYYLKSEGVAQMYLLVKYLWVNKYIYSGDSCLT